jgi:hypothetical protein
VVGGRRAVKTVNTALKDLAGKAWCPWHLTIRLLIEDGNPNGEREEALDRLEEEFLCMIGSVAEVDHVGRLTVDGICELHFYLDAPEEAHAALTTVQATQARNEFDHTLSYDPSWSQIAHLLD